MKKTTTDSLDSSKRLRKHSQTSRNSYGICESFFHYLLTWMESLNVFTICLCKWHFWMLFYDFYLYEWNMRMFSLLFVYMNGICECFLYGLFIWIESVKVFFNCKFIWIEHMCIFFIPCLRLRKHSQTSRNSLSQLCDPSLSSMECFDIIVEHVLFPWNILSNIRLRDHSRGLAVGRSISWSNLSWRGNDCFIVDWSLFRGIYFMGREHVQLLYQSTP
jgi:hypothetical protein